MLKFLFILIAFVSINTYAQEISTYKPWAYWWWMGSAVTKDDIKANLSDYAAVGIGGLHIIPIYSVKGFENKNIQFRSKAWYEMLDFTISEAKRLGLGIDITLGTGWPYGGPQVTEQYAAQKYKITDKNQIISIPTGQKVKRAAPGGEGWVMDHFNKDAVNQYIQSFEEEFRKKNHGVRAFYNDSYEVYGANWTPDFPAQFLKRKGYSILDHLHIFYKDSLSEHKDKLIMIDYHETLSDLLLESFTYPVQSFATKYHKYFRNEAHGSPANILDLYAASDIPETEYFGSRPYDIPLVNQDKDYSPLRYGVPGTLMMKLASSPAHIMGKKLVSSETATWLANHFKVSLRQIKPIIDESFISGVNHIFYHGITYSPKSETWPGWLFYASTNFNQQSHFYNHLPLLNAYIERCQYYLQNSTPDQDLLVYLPIHDEWSKPGNADKLNPMDVHSMMRTGIFSGSLGKLCNEITHHGFQYDFISDKQLHAAVVKNKKIFTTGNPYKAIIIPECAYLPLKTIEKLNQLKQNGVTVIFQNNLPSYVTGWHNNKANQSRFELLTQKMSGANPDPVQSLHKIISTEEWPLHSLSFIRKKYNKGWMYFIANQHSLFSQDTVFFNQSIHSAILFDPATNEYTDAKIISNKNKSGILLDLESGNSIMLFINCIPDKMTKGVIQKIHASTETLSISGKWKINFIEGAPVLPASFESDQLISWTQAPDTMSRYFSGSATYTTQFKLTPDWISDLKINLGDVRESAEVKINGKYIGTAWYAPYTLKIPRNILQSENTIEIKVTNLSANRIKYLDMIKLPWKKFYDINIVDINYKPFDAGDWEIMDAGLIGEVNLSKQ